MRGLAESVNGERAALAHVHLVGVHLEDALLGELLLQLDGDQHLRELALDGLLRGEEEAARELHGDGRAALAVAAFAQVDRGRFHQAEIIHAAVLEEAAVFDGQHRVHQHWGMS